MVGPSALPPDQLDRVNTLFIQAIYHCLTDYMRDSKYNSDKIMTVLAIMTLFFLQYNRLINDMLAIYNAATICAYNDPFRCGLRLYPGNTSRIMLNNDQIGTMPSRRRRSRFVAAKFHGFT